jgi:hypothetical protein
MKLRTLSCLQCCSAALLMLLTSAPALAVRPATDAELRSARGLDCNGQTCDQMTGDQCSPGTPGPPTWGNWLTCANYSSGEHGSEGPKCASLPAQNQCYIPATGPYCKNDVCTPTPNNPQNNCVLHTDGWCVQLQTGYCGDKGEGLMWVCGCKPDGGSVTSGTRDWCR